MTTEERIDQLMLDRGINKSQLSKGANIPYTTIDGIFKKGAHNIKLSTLLKLADYFHVTLDYLVGRSDNDFTPTELEQIEKYKAFLLYERSNNGKN